MKSISLIELTNKLHNYLNEHPEDANKEIYFDCLHVNGDIQKINNNILELI